MKKLALLGIFALSACSSAPPLFTSDGRSTLQIDCSGGSGFGECQRRAQVACGSGGVDVLSQSDSSTRTMVIACRKTAPSY